METTAAAKRQDLGLLLLRIALGGIILFHGVFKLRHGVAWIQQPLGALGLPGVLAYGTYVAEVIAPVLVILGFRTRIAALAIAFDMLMAIVLVLRPRVFTINEMGGGWAIEVEALILLVALTLCFTGAGRHRIGPAPTAWD